MNIYLSENIKRLRREKGLTQENLAEYFGVSFQSVSNWERGEAYPDITLLPRLAVFFNVSVDELLGVNNALAQERIEEYLKCYETMRYKDTDAVFLRFQTAVKDFPGDFRILVRYMELLMFVRTEKDSPEYDKTSRELMAIYENIRGRCTDDGIRMWAKRLICQHLHTRAHYTGRDEYQLQAEEILSEMPSLINTKDYLSTMLISDKDKHYTACSQMIDELLFLLAHSADHYCLYDENFTVLYRIEAIEKMLAIFDIIYTDHNYGKLWLDVIYYYGHLGHLYYEAGNDSEALENLEICAVLAKEYDALPECSERTAQFFENRVYKKTERGKTMCQRMKQLMTEKYPLSEEFKASEGFNAVLAML